MGTVKRIVTHPRLYLAVGGKIQHVPKGTEVTVTLAQAEKLGKKLTDPAQQKRLDATVEGGKTSEGADANAELETTKKSLADANAELETTKKSLADANAELETTKKSLADANTALAATAAELETTKKSSPPAKKK